MTRTGPARLLAALAAGALLFAACGDDDDEDAATESPTTEEADDAGTSETSAPDETSDTTDDGEGAATPAGAATVELADSELGQILVSEGMTLYIFMPDDGGPSTCYDDCAMNWPALMAGGDVTVGEGLDQSLFGTAPREDGGEQVTVDGWPLYFYAADQQPGDTLGQGVGDVWFVVGPDGSAIES